MRIVVLFFSSFCLFLTGFCVLLSFAPNPEKLVLGEWKETDWQYMSFASPADSGADGFISGIERAQYAEHVIYHEAESWCFNPDGTLILTKPEATYTLKWFIKGRGNVLELRYNDNRTEHYNMHITRDGVLELYHELDTGIKGTAKF